MISQRNHDLSERMHDRARYALHNAAADLFEIIRTTRSMRRVEPDPVPKT
jgi:hypothetical protein